MDGMRMEHQMHITQDVDGLFAIIGEVLRG